MASRLGAFERTAGFNGRARARTTSWSERLTTGFLVLLWLALATAAAVPGVAYYLLPLQARPFAPDHARYAPTGIVGLRLGIAGSVLMLIGVATYMLRKRWSLLARFGKLTVWLQFHIFLGTLGPYFVLLHTSVKIGGLVSIAFWSMTLVVASGVFGRYVYAHIPKTLNGTFRTKQELADERVALLQEIDSAQNAVGAVKLPHLQKFAGGSTVGSISGALLQTMRFERSRHRHERELQRWLDKSQMPARSRAALLGLLRRERELERQIALITPFQRLFRYWHLFHLPLALLMLAILAVHVVIAVLFGYAWPF